MPITYAAAIVFIMGMSIYLLFILPTQWLKIERVSVNIGLNMKILQLSDLHVERLRINSKRVKILIEQEKPDYIFITGDFTKHPHYLSKLQSYLKVIRHSGIPCYSVLGNHDYQQPKVRKLIGLIENYGIPVLRNESLDLGRFQLIGIDDMDSGKSNIKLAYSKVASGTPVLIITHDPNLVLRLNRRFDYLMAGHLHGKQFNVPFFYSFRPMGPLPAMGIHKGLHKTNFGLYYISKGMGQTACNARFMVRSEVTIHSL